jgi:cell wall-associated NlpC family hydrolase
VARLANSLTVLLPAAGRRRANRAAALLNPGPQPALPHPASAARRAVRLAVSHVRQPPGVQTRTERDRWMAKLAVALASVVLAAVVALGGVAAALGGSSGAAGLGQASGIPGELVPVIERAAGAFCDLPPPLLAAVLKVESGFDNAAVNPRSGAFTMAQFLPGTWEEWKVNGNPDQGPAISPSDPVDVIFSAARYLCALGAGDPDSQRLAVAAYSAGPNAVARAGGIPHKAACPEGHPPSRNRQCETADYVRKVFAQAAAYAADTTLALPAGDQLARVINFAYSKIGTPYQWGGDGTNGFYDCSGFTMRAYEQAGVRLPRTSRQQYLASPHVGLGKLATGDLLFWAYNTADLTSIHHVAIYLGRDAAGVEWMIDAPHTGATIQVRRVYWTGLIGATRPLAGLASS